jgi:hypothetical protein
MFAYGVAEIRAQGRHHIKVYYDPEMQMSCLEIGDEVISTKVYLPTHKLSNLLLEAYEAQTRDPNAIGTSTWLGKPQPVSVA